MPRYRHALPQHGERLFLTDGGIETTLIFHDGLELPHFAAFDLLKTAEGTAALERYFRGYAGIATRLRTGLILESATWRANPDWGARLGYSEAELAQANRKAVELLVEIRESMPQELPVVLSGCIGPRADGYDPGETMTPAAAEAYHSWQIDVLAETDVDMVCALTIAYSEEAIGMARAARKANMPIALAFTVETNGRLPTGQSLEEAVAEVDAATRNWPEYYMINCAHPTHFEFVLDVAKPWTSRLKGVRANASMRSHAELNAADRLDTGNPAVLAVEHAALKRRLPGLTVFGGCCGTDCRHVEQIALACGPLFETVEA
ncbi:MAG: homocysteine S-methyltransferase family protein [Rhodothermales bacterium]|nr:homocysteine S-methyltransferase family protein [Rhodothermales bacterium]MBO6778915.1 homocysteine S-methyltransferase family protein [Rhodothermales bacterium]